MPNEVLTNYDFDAITHEALYVRAIWNSGGSTGSKHVLILAWSLGATRAYCLIMGDTRLIAGNYSACWLPSNQLEIQS